MVRYRPGPLPAMVHPIGAAPPNNPPTNNSSGPDTTAAPGKRALRQSAGEEDGQARGRTGRQAQGAAEEPHQQGLDQYVALHVDVESLQIRWDEWNDVLTLGQFCLHSSSAEVCCSRS